MESWISLFRTLNFSTKFVQKTPKNKILKKKPYQNRSQDITMYHFVKIHSIWRMFIFVTKFVQQFKMKKRKNRE